MKIYTEVNYELKNGSLVEQSSKFYNYDGQIAECKSSGKDVVDELSEQVDKNTDTIQEGPKGSFGDAADKLYGGDFKAGIESTQETWKDIEGGYAYYRDLAEDEVERWKEDEMKNFEKGGADKPEEETNETTSEEKESLLTQGLVAEGGRKMKYGRKAMSTGTESGSILTTPPLQ